jgi:hypothetical protein
VLTKERDLARVQRRGEFVRARCEVSGSLRANFFTVGYDGCFVPWAKLRKTAEVRLSVIRV